MKKPIILITILLLFTSIIKAQEVPTKPDYLEKATYHFDLLLREYSKSRIETEVNNKNVRWISNLMASTAVFYEATGEEKYLEMCKETFKVAMDKWNTNSSLMSGTDDFFATKHVAYAAAFLKKVEAISTEYDKVIEAFANSHFQRNFVVDHNQAQERALGFVRMQNLLPRAGNAALWRAYTEAVWNFWYKNLDVDEDATNYCAIHINDILLIAEESGKTDQLLRPEIKKWFDRYRDQQAPSGYMPEYGDDYFFAYFEWITCFERLARLYDDPSYLNAAWKLFNIGYPNIPAAYYTNTFDLKRAADWSVVAEVSLLSEYNVSPVSTSATSLITTRTNKYGETDLPDQLLLGSSRNPGTPFLMSDLYARAAHSHVNMRGTINYYEVDNYPLFHGVERHATDARSVNTVVMVKQEDEGFPFAKEGSRKQTGKWFTDGIDFTPSTLIDENDPSMRGLKNLTFRFQGKVGDIIHIDNIRLVGKAGELLLDSCDDLTGWASIATLTDDAVEGKAVKITLTSTNVTFVGLQLEKDFSLKDYQFVTIDWKHYAANGGAYSDLNFIIRVHNKLELPGDEYVHANAGTLFNLNTLESSHVEISENDSYGEIILNDHFLPDTRLTRRMLLTEEGVLILQDYLEPTEEAIGYTAGSLWQLYRMRQKGENWFNSPGENFTWRDTNDKAITKELLVYFETKEEREYGNQQAEYTVEPMIVYSKEDIKSTQPLSFVTILIPHAPGTRAEYYATNINSQTEGQNSEISLKLHGRQLTITMNEDRTWKIERKEIPIDPDEKEEINIFTNGSINDIAAGIPVDWSSQGNSQYCTYDATTYHTIPSSLKITGEVNNWRGWRHADIPVEEGATYRIRMYTKTENVDAASRVYVTFGVKDKTKATWIVPDNDNVTQSLLVDNVKGTHEWILIENEYTIPSNGAYISYFTPRMNSSGKEGQAVWFDDFSMVKIAEPSSIEKSTSNTIESNIYPNPLSDNKDLTIEFNAEKGKNTITLFDGLGQQLSILHQKIYTQNQKESLTFPLSFLKEGIYLIEVFNPIGKTTHKVMVTN